MSKAPETVSSAAGTGQRKPLLALFPDWITRPVFGLLLGGIAITVLYLGGYYFALFIAAVVIAAAREWHRMIADGRFTEEFLLTSLIVIGGVSAAVQFPASYWPWLIVGTGTAISLILALLRGRRALWEAGGVLYLGIPALSIVLLRILPADGFWLLLVLFAAIWATDTGGLIVGNLLRGPKLWPALSPNKTWAGFFGGIVFAAVAGGGIFAMIQRDVGRGVLFAVLVAILAHLGDLFESWAKRSFRIKNSGGLIPGHGGVLDRVDSTLLAAPLLAALVLIVGLNPMGAI